MSTKSDIICTNDGRIYHETSQNQSTIFGKWLGHDIEIVINMTAIKYITFKDLCLQVELKPQSEIFKEIGVPLRIFGGNIISFEIDEEDLMVTVKGGSFSEEKLSKRDFS